jgi:hypothetical protein
LEYIPEEQSQAPNTDDDNADPQYVFISPLDRQAKEEKADAQLDQPHVENVRRRR